MLSWFFPIPPGMCQCSACIWSVAVRCPWSFINGPIACRHSTLLFCPRVFDLSLFSLCLSSFSVKSLTEPAVLLSISGKKGRHCNLNTPSNAVYCCYRCYYIWFPWKRTRFCVFINVNMLGSQCVHCAIELDGYVGLKMTDWWVETCNLMYK